MNPILLQKQLRENSADVNDFYKELKAWSEDTKVKKQSLQKTKSAETTKNSVPKKHKIIPDKPKAKRPYTDYSAWEKFDADAECEKSDSNENEDSDLTDEYDEAVRDEAYAEKEKGNKLVKAQKWNEAIECYNRAINCYSYDPVFYANRALCFLKKQDYTKAELDCTMSIKLDSSYAKAFYRRAVARENLGKLEEAEADLLKVLELEPKNTEASSCLDMLRKKHDSLQKCDIESPISKFSASRKKIHKAATQIHSSSTASVVTNKEDNSVKPDNWNETDDITYVKAVVKPAHLRSKKLLKRIEIKEVRSHQTELQSKQAFPSINEPITALKTNVFERQSPVSSLHEILKEDKQANGVRITAGQTDANAPTHHLI